MAGNLRFFAEKYVEMAKEDKNKDQAKGPVQDDAQKKTDEKYGKKDQKKLDELNAKLEEASKKNEELQTKVQEAKDDYIRLMAEFETFRRRNAEDKLNLINNAAADTIKGLLPVLDDCERAMDILAQSSDEAAKEGTELIYNKLMAYLKTKGLAPIEAKGARFDVDFHEAVTQFPTPDESMKGMVIDVVQTGYLLNGKVLRYAKVVVGA